MKKVMAVLILVGLASQANAWERVNSHGKWSGFCASKVMKLGPDTYWGKPNGNGCGKEYVIKDAAYYCANQGKEFLVTKLDGVGRNQIHFQCLAKDDSDYVRPTYEKDPDVVVQVRH